ncbi:MAG: sodium/proline symporter PutP [Oscillospiraceae bacterium]|nr:sodium/proline symporter PutP [Oscillospiraceae bacterium]
MGFFANADIPVLIAFVIYLGLMLGIGFYFSNKSKKMSDYFLAGRSLGSWVTAMSAQASDMSGWLLMGLPGAAYATGLGNYWIAIGLAAGTILNWIFVAKPLRRFTEVCGDSITIPQYLQNRFQTDSPLVRMVCAVVIFVFFLVYTTSAFVSGGKLFQVVFNVDSGNEVYNKAAVILSALIIVTYTFFGGFSAVAWTDFVQGLLMVITIVALPIALVSNTPDFSTDMLNSIPKIVGEGGDTSGYMSLTSGMSAVEIISNLAWCFGYFGMPHILVRFMAIKDTKSVKKSGIIAVVWVLISLTAAVLVGVLGRAYLDSQNIVLSSADMELIFITTVKRLFPSFLGGIFLSAVLASIMSTADSQLLVTASAVVNDFYILVVKKDVSEKKQMWISRLAVIAVSVIACILALNPNDSIMGIVSNAWAGFGAAFGPAIVLSLYWRRLTLKGTVSGIIGGTVTVLFWEYILPSIAPGPAALYSILPGILVSVILTVAVSMADKEPDKEVLKMFDKARHEVKGVG